MEIKLAREMSQAELAEYLTSLAAQIRQGELQLAGMVQSLPPQATVEIEVKEKKGRLSAKVFLSFATLEQYDQTRRAAVEQKAESFKAVKKRLGASFANLKKAVAAGKLPEESLVGEFLRDNEAFAQQADPDWQAEMDVYLDHVKNLEKAFVIGNLEMFGHELEDLRNSMAQCHKEFK